MQNVIIIAEAGINHNGDINIAKRLVDEACQAGADYIKFQTFVPEKLVSRYAQLAEYQKIAAGKTTTQLQMLRNAALKNCEFESLHDYCVKCGIGFLSTPFDLESIEFLSSLQMPYWKIPSGEITNLPYLVKVAEEHKPIILSTGMSTLKEVEEAVRELKSHGAGEISLLHCTTEYPAPYDEVNLNAIMTMKNKFGLEVGYSDHTKGIEIPIAAVAMGASIIEKHFTLSCSMEGPDHKASLEPSELRRMVQGIRNVQKALGDAVKEPSLSERKNLVIARKSIIAGRSIRKGEIFTEQNLTTKRPGNGISPMKWYDVLGKRAVRDFEEDELIEI